MGKNSEKFNNKVSSKARKQISSEA